MLGLHHSPVNYSTAEKAIAFPKFSLHQQQPGTNLCFHNIVDTGFFPRIPYSACVIYCALYSETQKNNTVHTAIKLMVERLLMAAAD